MRLILLALLAAIPALAQQPVTIRVNAGQTMGPFKPIYGYFGYDEPNYTYTKNGSKLVGELAALSSVPVYVRTHFLLATGDGTPGLKWGSTNAYTEDGTGKPVYDWTIIDRIFDTYLQAGAKPFVEIGFMPKALSSKPEPYHPTWIPGDANKDYSIGWSYPPRDYARWGELVYQWVRHSVEKYGREQVASWYWELWNEPDISYWHGTPEEYDKLYDYTAAAVKRALPSAKVGGPASTGPSGAKAAAFLRQFLEHCDRGTNLATGTIGAPLDFITYHAKGRPSVVDGHVRMGMAKNAKDVDEGYQIVHSFPKFRNLPIVLSESDPEGCAACSARVYPQNAYRNGTLYPAYTAVMMKNIFELADREQTNIAGMLTWAFQFEDQPYFDGFRTLATNGIDKPVLNLFRMLGLMRGDRLKTENSSRVPLTTILADGVRSDPDVDAFAVRADHELSVLAWNYHDDDLPGPQAKVSVDITGLPRGTKRVLQHHYRIDEMHSNSWAAWKKMGSPQQPSPEQYATLEAAGQLQQLDSPQWIDVREGATKLDLTLPRQGVSLVQLSW
ncbi:MAG TPA: glycoside hydrolase family 44 protein [Candidatus Dormibacteraeota bacterium]|nr:glycoside hydrolase family 44 protein [Candidatus Dormibacteraeota bacterium]